MRVIAGSARSLPLKTPAGFATRPTTDRIKETLFNMLSPDIPGCRFLDLFAGSGAIGIEALSRGAEAAVFVEQDKKTCGIIEDNLRFTRLIDKAEVMTADVLTGLTRLEGRQVSPFHIIFMDPPYEKGLEETVLQRLQNSPLLTDETLIIFEASMNTDIGFVEALGYTLLKDKQYKTNRHVWLKRGR